jgi:malate dehydrogenase (oxaloacetate-decarboxylating)(NADP+)
VAVVSNGTAVLGLGQHRRAGLQAGDGGQGRPLQEVRQHRLLRHRAERRRPRELAAIVCALEPTFGAINLEDIKAPRLLRGGKLCRERMNIPVFHD